MATYDTSYYDNAYEEFEKKQKQSAENQKAQTEEDYNNRLKQAYISNRQTQKATNDALTSAGIRGGMTETSALKNALAYQNTRTGLQTERANAIREIDKNADDNIFAYKQTTDAAAQSYIEQRQAEDRQIAQTEAENKAAQEREDNINFWTSKYSTYYTTSALNKAYKNAKTTAEKAIIKARIGYLKAQKKGY